MANPNPQHNPTDGLNVAAYVQVSGTNVVAGKTVAANHPNPANYSLTLSLSASGGFAATCQLTTIEVDVANNTYTPVNSPTYKSYNDPANKAGSPPAWYNPSNGSAGGAAYDPNVASVSSSGLITARAVGQAIIEVGFPTFDNTLGNNPQGEPDNFIYTQIVVTVIP